ncbi:hypothetical protein [Streptomyces sp. gCLA4]|uniref:hypothetical protein n=1 Tax=Streptomyces sp. gCLA4 TaxID=1873416 RepID=UPI0016042D8A|nr:hypothetical protein [Streptomyces sp. gCLA4]
MNTRSRTLAVFTGAATVLILGAYAINAATQPEGPCERTDRLAAEARAAFDGPFETWVVLERDANRAGTECIETGDRISPEALSWLDR